MTVMNRDALQCIYQQVCKSEYLIGGVKDIGSDQNSCDTANNKLTSGLQAALFMTG